MDNEAVVRRAIDAIWNRGELFVADELFDSAYVNHNGLIPDLIRGPEAIKISVVVYRTAFPGLHITVEESSSEGDTVVTVWTAHRELPRETDELSMQGQALMRGVTRSLLSQGKIVESWTQWNETELLPHFGNDPHG